MKLVMLIKVEGVTTSEISIKKKQNIILMFLKSLQYYVFLNYSFVTNPKTYRPCTKPQAQEVT